MTNCTAIRIEDMEHAFGGAFVRARASLGVTAFGMQVIQLPPDSAEMAPEHDHLHDGQEEVYAYEPSPNSVLGGPEILAPTASPSMTP